MARRSRYPAGKNTPHARSKKSSRGNSPLTRYSVPVSSSQEAPESNVLSAPIPSDPVQESLVIPSYITRELKRIGIITAAMIIILVILAITL